MCVVLRHRDGQAQADILCAGHPLPILVRGGAADYVGELGPMLGAFAEESPITITLRPRDLLVLYSDGLPDAVGRKERFGRERLQHTLAPATSAPGAVARVERALADFQVGPQVDDTAVLAVEALGVPDTAPATEPMMTVPEARGPRR